jgi:hypothetical protein
MYLALRREGLRTFGGIHFLAQSERLTLRRFVRCYVCRPTTAVQRNEAFIALDSLVSG